MSFLYLLFYKERQPYLKRRKMLPNREYKDALFKFLFGREERKEWTLSLYNAVNNSNYTNADDLTIVTLEDILYVKMKNDVSFMFGATLNLYEQQSSWNPNMPFRLLEYAMKEFEGYIEKKNFNMYSSKPITLPAPKCVVFYNGEGNHKPIEVLRLSDLYENGKKGDIEVVATVYNINRGANNCLQDKCKVLDEYSWLVNYIKNVISNNKQMSNSKMVGIIEEAIDNMPNSFSIKKLLETEKSEVIGMLKTEFNEQEFKNAVYSDGFDEGFDEGFDKGFDKGIGEGVDKGINKMAIKVIKSALAMDMKVEQISKLTSLSIEEVKKIISSISK